MSVSSAKKKNTLADIHGNVYKFCLNAALCHGKPCFTPVLLLLTQTETIKIKIKQILDEKLIF